ncbi:HEAT repeat domain-containing protein [Nostoc sp. ChiQUE01b]|uniref:HEAT repeat domain-containing protein n=1 Tax=Nostoc sp. ChiQUE01b TaxID=3075376 RepID=UPI002AD35DD2|nr:HEAT repeat domain-containing protein [Nostoc sp. ChiQUE01b]MDZ8260162.1 HEAT repeat domain-containing protein [Nostoc sp. ChiQUE01b]
MTKNKSKFETAAIFMIVAVLGSISLPKLTNATMLVQTPLVQPQCTNVEIDKHIQELNKGAIADFDAIVACSSKAVPALMKALGNQDEELRIPAIAVLGEIGSKAALAVRFLKASLKDENRDVRIIAVQTLRKIGQDPILPLLNALKDDNWNVRYQATDTLGQIGTKDDVVLPLITALKDKNENVRSSAANALEEIGKDAVPALIIALKDPDSNIRAGVADALGQIGIDAEDAVPYLTTALKDIDSKVSSAAANALETINARQKIEEIYAQIEEYYARRCMTFCLERAGSPVSRQTTALHLRRNPPAMCKIPVIKAVLRWKCP